MNNFKKWAAAAAIRALKTAAQAAIGAVGAATVFGMVDWAVVGGTVALSAILSILTSLAGLPEVDDGASVAKIASSNEGNER